MTHKLVYSAAAEEDLLSLYDWIADAAGADTAAGYVTRVQERCQGLTDFPQRGTPRDDIEPGLRTAVFEGKALIAYRVSPADVLILRILNAGRDLGTAFSGSSA